MQQSERKENLSLVLIKQNRQMSRTDRITWFNELQTSLNALNSTAMALFQNKAINFAVLK